VKRYWTASVMAIVLCASSVGRSQNWPQFRGPGSLGVSGEKGLPIRWSSSDNVSWKTPLPGPGHSSPIVWGDRIFLTAFQPTITSRLLSYISSSRDGKLLALCLDRKDGKILWERSVPANAIEQVHSTNSPATPTPVTDGRYVYFYFGSYGLLCYDFSGNKVWEHPLGPFPNEWGSASSPVLYQNMLLLNCDTDGEDFLLALDKNTGKQLWKTSRNGATRAWPTPFVWETGERNEIVVSGSRHVRSYDPVDGKLIWTVDGLTQWVTPTPAAAHGLLFVSANGPGGAIIMAIRPGGRGNITGSHVVWRHDRAAPYSTSPVVLGDYLYAVKEGGILICLSAKTGELVYQKRLPATGSYYASPIASEGKIYTLSERGETCVVEEGSEFKVLATNEVGERCMASPAVSRGQIFIRSDSTLFCIGAPGL